MSDTPTDTAAPAPTADELEAFRQWQAKPAEKTAPAASQAVQVTATVRKPIVLEYPAGSRELYELPGRIPPEILTIQAGFRQPRGASKETLDTYQRELGAALIGAFYANVVPEGFRSVLDLEDLDQVFTIWSEHVGLGESKPSNR